MNLEGQLKHWRRRNAIRIMRFRRFYQVYSHIEIVNHCSIRDSKRVGVGSINAELLEQIINRFHQLWTDDRKFQNQVAELDRGPVNET